MTAAAGRSRRPARAGGYLESQSEAQALVGERVQSILRLVIVVLVAVQLILFPPRRNEHVCGVVLVVYALWAGIVLWRIWRPDHRPTEATWRLLLIDLLSLGSLLAISGGFETPDVTHPPVGDAFFLIPVLAAFQLRPGVTAVMTAASAAVFVPAVVLEFGSPDSWWPIVVYVVHLVLLGFICTLLSRVQRDRARSVGRLMANGRELLGQAMDAAERERRSLAEYLHNESLQNVLAARHEIEEARTTGTTEPLERAEETLAEASRQMRSVLTELHPVILEHLGLEGAVRRLVQNTEQRADLRIQARFGTIPRFEAERVAFNAAHELLNNVAQHADAHSCLVDLRVRNGRLLLRVEDDGRGIRPDALESSIRRGHIGLASLRVRIEAAGGTIKLLSRRPRGTTVLVELPLDEEAPD
ncbi:ATP-binding protein [Streptomyces sp. ZYX-F-203]